MLVIAPEVPAKTLQEFIAYAKANPGKLNFGFGQGTLPQLVGEMFKLATGIDIANIPYKGGAQAIPDMLGGRVQMNIGTISTLAPLVRAGQAPRARHHQRRRATPNCRTCRPWRKAACPRWRRSPPMGCSARPACPADVVRRLNAAVNESLKSEELRAAIRRIGFEPHDRLAGGFYKAARQVK